MSNKRNSHGDILNEKKPCDRRGVKKGFWNEERREKLWNMMTSIPRVKTDRQIASFFKRPRHEIYIIFSSIRKQKGFEPIIKFEDGVKITVFKPAYAVGVHSQPNVRSNQTATTIWRS